MNGQRVNFFQERFRPQRALLSWHALLLWWLLLLVLLVAGTLAGRAYLADRQAEWQRLGGERSEGGAAGMRVCRTAWEKLLGTELQGDIAPVAPVLEVLALTHREGIWLTRIEISQGGRQVSVQGNALVQQAAQLPPYVQSLARQLPLTGRDVHDFHWEKEPAVPAQGGVTVRAAEPLLKFRFIIGQEGSVAADPARRNAP